MRRHHCLALLLLASCGVVPNVTMQGNWTNSFRMPPIEGHPHPGPYGALNV